MTDTTDIKALPKMTLEDLLIRCTDYDDMSLSMDASELKMLKQHISLLEAERQRAGKAELELIQPLPIGELIQRLEGQTYEKWFSQSDLKVEQVPVAWIRERTIDKPEHKGKVWRDISYPAKPEPAAVDGVYHDVIIPLYDRPQKPVVVLTDCDIGAVSHMAHWYSEEQCEAWVAGVEHAKKQMVAAGCIVQTGDTDKEDDHQPSAPAVLHDVLTAVSIGGSRTELIDALTSIKPKFGTPGSRDVDVRAAHAAIDKAIEKLSNL